MKTKKCKNCTGFSIWSFGERLGAYLCGHTETTFCGHTGTTPDSQLQTCRSKNHNGDCDDYQRKWWKFGQLK